MMDKELHIAVSSLAFSGKTLEAIIEIAKQENYTLEFSSGMSYRMDMEEIFLAAPIKKILHNYFPAHEKPFVLNLASLNQEIRNRSVEHCINGLRLASLAGSPFFSAHAGFCVDPNPSELGKKLKQAESINKKENWKLFIGSLKTILAETEKYKTSFLIENNVIAPMNVYADGTNPLFCCDADEMIRMINEMKNPRLEILLDTGHIKVSSGTLGFSLEDALRKIKSFVKAIHHSDNDGIFDSNMPLAENYWFFNYIKDFGHGYHVLEVKHQSVEQINLQIELIKKNILN